MSEGERTDEDRIIESLVIAGVNTVYQDYDFLPVRNSLYNIENFVPEYDEDVGPTIQWMRPSAVTKTPIYFNQDSVRIAAKQGSLPDGYFLGALLAISVYSKYDLIENLFASRPDDFSKYGVYTCRFYVGGEWVEVITDTLLPCVKDNVTSVVTVAYGRSADPSEMWIPLLEKAFAKAVGSYEEVSHMKIQRALLHLTGGSVQAISLREEVNKLDTQDENQAWTRFLDRFHREECLMLILPLERHGASNGDAHTAQGHEQSEELQSHSSAAEEHNFFIPDAVYSIVTARELGGHELVLMHNPWENAAYAWSGTWSDSSNDWDLYPEMLVQIESDPSVPWRRNKPNGYFWISFRSLVKHFNKLYICKLFPSEKYSFYCPRGAFTGANMGGPLHTVRDRAAVVKEAAVSRTLSLQKNTAAVVVDGDSSWFTNPQFRIQCQEPTTLYISLLPVSTAENHNGRDSTPSMTVSLATSARTATAPMQLWDVPNFTVESSSKHDHLPWALKEKNMETSLWGMDCDPANVYHVVANTNSKGQEGAYILRVFSTKPVFLEAVPAMCSYAMQGEWRKTRDKDSTGGHLQIVSSDGVSKDNGKWCQNPQYHLEIADPYGKSEVFLKVVLYRTDKPTKDKKKEADAITVGLTICKADVFVGDATKLKKKGPRTNRLGELIHKKASTLKRRPALEAWNADPTEGGIAPPEAAGIGSDRKVILRKLTLNKHEYVQSSSFESKTEAVVFYPSIPRAWVPHGLIIVPSLSDKGQKGSYELKVHCSEPVLLNQLPENFAQSTAGEWTEPGSACGSHLCPSWKKNPRYDLVIRYPPSNGLEQQPKIRITLSRVGSAWRAMCHKDRVGCMLGFYVLAYSEGEQYIVYESPFVPDSEVSTESNFVLPKLPAGERYTVVPCTFAEGKAGQFVLSVLCEYEFDLRKEGHGEKGK